MSASGPQQEREVLDRARFGVAGREEAVMAADAGTGATLRLTEYFCVGRVRDGRCAVERTAGARRGRPRRLI